MKKFRNTIIIGILCFIGLGQNTYADISYFIDFSKVLNQSIAGSGAQKVLKSKLDSTVTKYKQEEDSIRKEEQKIISQRKIITKEEYKKKVDALRKKVIELQKNKEIEFNNLKKLRQTAKTELLLKLNPIIKKYMEDNKIRIVLDKKSILLADQKLEITDQIILILNKEIKKLKLN